MTQLVMCLGILIAQSLREDTLLDQFLDVLFGEFRIAMISE